MTIAQTRYWIDREPRSIGIRSSNRRTGTQPLECYAHALFRFLPSFYFYECSDDGGRELRLSARWLWFSLNLLVCMLPERDNGHRFDDRDREWGWYFIDGALRGSWGERYFYWNLPFTMSICEASQILSLTRNRVVFDDKNRRFLDTYKEREKAIKENSGSASYTYELLSGERQEVIAEFHVTRHVRRRKWWPFRYHDDSIWVNFSKEVGPERGSWKGGVTGCGWTLKKGETAIECLRRMERERRFKR